MPKARPLGKEMILAAMAKTKSNNATKISFGKRKCGKAKKTSGPKDKPTKPYNRQGR